MRPTCLRCLRPAACCVCAGLAPVATRTRVVILQHPREARLAICSARLAHLALAGSELHRGVVFEEHPRVRALAGQPGAALLFPELAPLARAATPDAPPAAPRAEGAEVRTLVAIDGTWTQAAKMVRANPRLAALPRLALSPARPSAYGELRREPGPAHLSTLEALALALGALEGDPARFAPMCDAFRRAVERQVACGRAAGRAPRHRPGAAATAWPR
jgi:DTW domain-containing protein YfiP